MSQQLHSLLGAVVNHSECEQGTLFNIGIASKPLVHFLDLEDKIIFKGVGNDMTHVVLVQCLKTKMFYNERTNGDIKDVEVEKLRKTKHEKISKLWCCCNIDRSKLLVF
jgi:hypothetical protein